MTYRRMTRRPQYSHWNHNRFPPRLEDLDLGELKGNADVMAATPAAIDTATVRT